MKTVVIADGVIRIDGEQCAISDGYHTFDELYNHRAMLYIALCRTIMSEHETHAYKPVWRSVRHSDGGFYPGWFILGLYKEPGKQITYHLPMTLWDETNFAETLTSTTVPEYDGHTPDDVLERLRKL